jgi:O-antigen/teichoic acid export membrane protein
MDGRSFFKHAAVYGLANLLTQAAGFVLLPVYLRCFSPAEFGVLEVVGRLAESVGTCLMFGGLLQALLTFYQQAEGATQRRAVVSSALALAGLSALAGGGAALLLLPSLWSWLGPYCSGEAGALTDDLLRLALLGILLEPFSLIPLALMQARVESVTYLLVVLGQFLFRVALAIGLVRGLGWGVGGAFLATAATGLVFGLALCGRELSRGLARPSAGQCRGLFAFALPLVPGGLCFFVLHHGDRFFLWYCGSAAEVGTYALGYKLAMTAGVFSLSPLYMVWSARMYAVARTPEAPVVFGRMFTRILAAYLHVGLGLCLFADEAVALLGGAAYARAAQVVAPVLLACVCQGASSLMDAGLYVRRRTGLKLGITAGATAVIVGLYAALIPGHGALGAALATLGGFAFMAACTWAVTQRVFPVRYEWGRLAVFLALTVAVWLAGQALPRAPGLWLAKGGLWLLAPVLLWVGGLISPAEKRFVWEQARRLRQALAGLRGAPAQRAETSS